MHFKVQLELGKKGSIGRTLYVRADNIMDAMTIGKKIRGGKTKSIIPISYKEYMKGVDKKYEKPQI